ncbi:hypothetical protein F5B22DRAFT_45881 [Xylaria bambusicola]|uniref:uncharacterized protein n=1 Tax=Xylaria bambusicola TaxID=326684 RepID=UPI002008C045|nr:uncharacterized protein F5B22DRAFT_45881 [Xylaria bambusicola]KAI0502794.1 hypothetical protein F5B22DRAFT_45881 [Xylaria bambusicola]
MASHREHPDRLTQSGKEATCTENELARQIESANDTKNDGENNFVFDCITSQSFGDYLGDTDTDIENSNLPPTRRWVWYCKLRACPDYYSAWSCKTNFLLHLYETPVHREDATTSTRKGRRQLAKAWREETAFDLSEPKKTPPEESNGEEYRESAET